MPSQPGKIHAALRSLLNEGPILSRQTLTLDELGGKLLEAFEKQKVLCLPNVLNHYHDASRQELFVDVNFSFHADDDSTLSLRTTGVIPADRLTNAALLTARKHALLGVFGLVIDEPAATAPPPKPTAQQVAQTINRSKAGAVTTASNLPTTPKLPEQDRQPTPLDPNAQKLLDWQTAVDSLNIEDPAEWDVHAQRLKDFTFLNLDQKKEQFERLKIAGQTFGVGYDPTPEIKRFYLLNVPALD